MRFIKRLPEMRVSRATWARAKVNAGAILVACGAAMVYLPAGVLIAGSLLLAIGLFLTDVDGR